MTEEGLRELYDQRFTSIEALREALFAAHEKMHVASAAEQDRKNAELNDVRTRFVARAEYEAKMEAIQLAHDKDVAALQSKDETIQRQQFAALLMLMANLGAFIGVLLTR